MPFLKFKFCYFTVVLIVTLREMLLMCVCRYACVRIFTQLLKFRFKSTVVSADDLVKCIFYSYVSFQVIFFLLFYKCHALKFSCGYGKHFAFFICSCVSVSHLQNIFTEFICFKQSLDTPKCVYRLTVIHCFWFLINYLLFIISWISYSIFNFPQFSHTWSCVRAPIDPSIVIRCMCRI